MLAEGNRQVTFRENGKVIQLSAMQLVIRAAYAAAMRGDRWALRLLMERTQQIESSDREERIENFTMMVEYQTAGRHAIAKARTAGLPDPEMLPHPDDIVIDMVTGDTTICGPVTLEDKAAWDDMLTSRDSIQKVVSYCAQEYRRASGAARKAELLDSWHEVQARYDMINGNLPPRYRKELADRSLAEGATFPGSQKARDWPGE